MALATVDTSDFFLPGFRCGKTLTPVVHAGIFSGQFEFGGNIMPLWQAYTPPPHEQTFSTRCRVAGLVIRRRSAAALSRVSALRR